MISEFEDFAQKLRDNEELVRAKNPSRESIAEVYALYKQGSVGDVNIARPGMWNMLARGKWDAWNSKKGMSSE